MKISLAWNQREWTADLDKPMVISIPINQAGNPGCYFTEPVKIEVIKAKGFIGSIDLGGTVNHKRISISPHGNGTHTECYGHISRGNTTINNQLKTYHIISQLITITPEQEGDDMIIGINALRNVDILDNVKGLIIRCLPNSDKKLHNNYSGTNPPYFTKEAMGRLVDNGIEHLVTDLPSVDKEIDEGKLSAHKTFWQTDAHLRPFATITELAYIKDSIKDGHYLLNLQIMNLSLDASPSNPVLYALV